MSEQIGDLPTPQVQLSTPDKIAEIEGIAQQIQITLKEALLAADKLDDGYADVHKLSIIAALNTCLTELEKCAGVTNQTIQEIKARVSGV